MTDPELPKRFEETNNGKDDSDEAETDLGLKRKKQFESVKHAEENDKFNERLLKQEVDSEEAMRSYVKAIEEFKTNPDLKKRLSPDLVAHIHRAARAAAKDKAKRGEFPAKCEADLEKLTLTAKTKFFVATTKNQPKDDQEKFNNFGQEIEKILPTYVTLDQNRQLEIASTLKDKWKFNGDANLLRKIMIVSAKDVGDLTQMKLLVKDASACDEYIKQVNAGANSEIAFNEAIKKGSPELQQSLQDYYQQWQSPSISDVFPNNPTTVAGINVELPSNDQVQTALAAYKQDGVRMDISPNSHVGAVYINETIMREAAVYIVDNEPKLFIYDNNADDGVRGPVGLDKRQETFFEISVDDYFSRKFREFSTIESEKDPTKVGDNKLLKMAHAFFPASELREIRLDIHTRQLLDNLAYFCVTPDKYYIAVGDKIKFFDRVINDPSLSWTAKKLLSEKNFTKKPNSLSTFEAELIKYLKPNK